MSEAPREVADLRETARLIEREVGRVIVGQETVVRGVVIALLVLLFLAVAAVTFAVVLTICSGPQFVGATGLVLSDVR